MKAAALMQPDATLLPYDDEYDNEYNDESEYIRQLAQYYPRLDKYRTEVTELSDDRGFYWHLYSRDNGRRVNGGLAGTWSGALHAARLAAAYGHGSGAHERY